MIIILVEVTGYKPTNTPQETFQWLLAFVVAEEWEYASHSFQDKQLQWSIMLNFV